MNVKNSRSIKKLATKSLKKSFVRNLIAISAIALTTLMITSVFSVAFSFKTASKELESRMHGCYASGYIDELTDEQYQELLANPATKKTGTELKVGTFSGQPFEKKSLELSYLDENSAIWHFVTLAEGHMPEAKDEIVLDKAVLQVLGIDAKLGTEVTLPYQSYQKDAEPGVKTATFRLAGYFEENAIGPCHYACCSEAFAKEAGYVNRTNVVTNTDVVYVAPEGVSTFQIGSYGEQTNVSGDNDSLVLIALFLVVIALSGYLIIYNIFQISVVNDISYYGLLKTIGVTGKQIKKIVRIQSLILSAVGIPIGILLGTGVGAMTSPISLKSTILSSVADSYSTTPWIWVLSALFALITVFISCSKPGRIAAGISPVEAFKYSEVKVDNKNNRHVSGLFGMAGRNMSRNKKKTVLVFLSMSLPIVILSLGLSFANNMSFEKFYSSDYAFKVSNTDYFNYEVPRYSEETVNDFISDRDIENINSQYQFETSGSAYTFKGISETKEGNWSVVTGLDDCLFDKVQVVEGDLSPLFNGDSHAIALNENGTDFQGQSVKNLKVGDKVTINYSFQRVYDTRTGETLDQAALLNTPTEYIGSENSGTSVDYTICAVVKPSDDVYIGYMFMDAYAFVLPSETLKKDTDGNIYRYLQVFDSPDQDKVASAEEFIEDYSQKNGLAYSSDKTERATFKTFEDMIRRVVTTLCIVLSVIGILNFINAVLTGITTRSHEFAVLKTIGMTDHQQKRVLVTEGMFYCLGSILLGSGCYTLLHAPFVKLFEGLDYVTPQFSLFPMSMIAVIFVILGIAIPYLVYSVVARRTVVERLRINE